MGHLLTQGKSVCQFDSEKCKPGKWSHKKPLLNAHFFETSHFPYINYVTQYYVALLKNTGCCWSSSCGNVKQIVVVNFAKFHSFWILVSRCRNIDWMFSWQNWQIQFYSISVMKTNYSSEFLKQKKQFHHSSIVPASYENNFLNGRKTFSCVVQSTFKCKTFSSRVIKTRIKERLVFSSKAIPTDQRKQKRLSCNCARGVWFRLELRSLSLIITERECARQREWGASGANGTFSN